MDIYYIYSVSYIFLDTDLAQTQPSPLQQLAMMATIDIIGAAHLRGDWGP